ncbi:hypothetical protein [Paenibacillus sp. UNC451MF]|nr:hypothetical protein [Paenibacillus sp. UNC451MF]
MMNLFELEMQMKERQMEVEQTANYRWAAQISMLDWMLGSATIGILSFL